ncbi:nucleotide exchange factor GrpE [Endothiovibrio diazotrophicus]
MSPEEKERLLAELAASLDEWEATPPPADEPPDLHTLLAEMAALKNEVRLEARQFKGGLEEQRGLVALLQEHNERLARDLERAREEAAAAPRRAERRLLLELLDLHDRLEAGLRAADRHHPSPLARLVPAEGRFIASLVEGQTLTRRRLEELFHAHRLERIATLGRPLDPHRMKVAATRAADGEEETVPEGIVLEELRSGWLHLGEPLRLAEVVVHRRNPTP